MKHARHLLAPNTLQSGHYIFWQHRTYQVIAPDPDNALLLIDAYSRSILGMALLYEDPCIESIQQALKHAIWEKSSHLDFRIEQEWACYGIPLQLFLDNAWAHHSHSLENLARVLSRNGTYNSIDLVFRPPYKGRYGAIIERLFKNFSGQIKELVAGAIQSSHPKARRAARNAACLLYPDMNRLLHQLILKYQHTPHRELGGMSPHQKWSEGIQSSRFPLVPSCTPAMDRLFMRMYPQTRHVRSRGIPAFGLNYWSAELGGIERVDREGKAVQYHFRYDPTDVSRIALFRNGEWVGDGYARELQQADGTYRRLSLAEWKMAKRLVGSLENQAEGQTPAELALVSDCHSLSQQRTQEKKAAQRTGHCGSSLPLLSRCPQLATCLTCQGDLRTSEPSPFGGPDEAWTALRTRDLQWLLTSGPRYTGWVQAQLLGTRFRFLRQQRGLSIREVARRLGRDMFLVRAMDSLNRTKQANFRDYIRYADLLGYSLRQVFYLLI